MFVLAPFDLGYQVLHRVIAFQLTVPTPTGGLYFDFKFREQSNLLSYQVLSLQLPPQTYWEKEADVPRSGRCLILRND